MQILFVDETIPVLVDHVECLFELLDLGLVKHGKDIGGGPLRPLLGGLPLGTFARHGDASIWTCAEIFITSDKGRLDKASLTNTASCERTN